MQHIDTCSVIPKPPAPANPRYSFPPALLAAGALALLASLSAGCDGSPGGGGGDDDDSGTSDPIPVDFAFWSTDFEEGGLLPESFECGNTNPEILWEGVPAEAVSLALIFDDPTVGNFPHWAIYNIPPSESGLDGGISGQGISNDLPEGAEELTNGAEFEGYLGSCPCASTPNTYRWRLWALNAELDDPGSGSASAQFSALAGAAEDAEIEMLEMSHRYGPASLCP